MAWKRELHSPDKVIPLYDGTEIVEYYDAKHYYFVNNRYTPGVTTYTGVIDKSGPLIGWAVKLAREFLLEKLALYAITEEHIIEACKQHTIKKKAAADKGTQVHSLAEAWIKASSPKKKKEVVDSITAFEQEVQNGFLAFLSWVKTHRVKFLESEKLTYSKKHKYVGTLDCIFTMGDEKHAIRHLGDFKTSNYIKPDMVFQVTGYEGAVKEEEAFLLGRKKLKKKDLLPWGDKYILRFAKDTGDFEIYQIPMENHDIDFKAFIACVTLKNRLTQIEREFKN